MKSILMKQRLDEDCKRTKIWYELRCIMHNFKEVRCLHIKLVHLSEDDIFLCYKIHLPNLKSEV
jgi:hypothetical protein